MAKGGFDTTRKGRRGSRTSLPSAWTMTTLALANCLRRSCARFRCSSKAITNAPRLRSGPVNAPEPAPMSSTRSPGRIPALSTSRSAHCLSSRCHPHRVRCSDTADHHEHCHGFNVRELGAHVNDNVRVGAPGELTFYGVCDERCQSVVLNRFLSTLVRPTFWHSCRLHRSLHRLVFYEGAPTGSIGATLDLKASLFAGIGRLM
jgi:hypothetical protein